jgi:hypothetical protein
MAKFKVGDVIKAEFKTNKRTIVTIERIGPKGYVFERVGNGFMWPEFWVESNFKLARIANTAITRKLYPHYKEDGEYLICTEKNS